MAQRLTHKLHTLHLLEHFFILNVSQLVLSFHIQNQPRVGECSCFSNSLKLSEHLLDVQCESDTVEECVDRKHSQQMQYLISVISSFWLLFISFSSFFCLVISCLPVLPHPQHPSQCVPPTQDALCRELFSAFKMVSLFSGCGVSCLCRI